MSWILGINHFFHDTSACLMHDGKLVVALEQERFSRQKHEWRFPDTAIERCLDTANIDFQDIDHIALSIAPWTKFGSRLAHACTAGRQLPQFIHHELIRSVFRQRDLRTWYRHHYPRSGGPQQHFIRHHDSHAAGSFLVSPWDEAAILSLDGAGEWACGFFGHGQGTRVKQLGELNFPHSLGSFYEAVTDYCGFQPNYDEGKTMGLAPYGDASRFAPKVRELLQIGPGFALRIDPSCFNYQYAAWRRYSPLMERRFGPARQPGAPLQDHHRDLAAAFQMVLEECALHFARTLKEQTRSRHLVISGGVALNSVMNGRLLREAGFDDVYIMPAAGDNGTCIGAAAYVWNRTLNNPKRHHHDNPFLGTSYSETAIEQVLKNAKIAYQRPANIAQAVAERLREGKIFGWFQGPMEIGPRALGARSILADPSLADMKTRINAEVKHREAWRPFAPVTLAEQAQAHFDIDVEAPFMLKVCPVKSSSKDKLGPIVHVDGSARLQTLRRSLHPTFYQLIEELGALSGIPVILNTSFNVMGEPVVESPTDALRCYFSTGLDGLAIGPFLLEKPPLS